MRPAARHVLKLAGLILGLFFFNVSRSFKYLPEHTPLLEAVFFEPKFISGGKTRRIYRSLWEETPRRAVRKVGVDRGIPVGGSSIRGAVPDARWPVSVSSRTEEYEEIVHPGDSNVTMFVPRFWSDSSHDAEPMSKDAAMKIGTCVSAGSGGSFVRGYNCPHYERSIFVSLVSYRDYHCRVTLENLFFRASHPERIRVGA